jgi:hypothetical protein
MRQSIGSQSRGKEQSSYQRPTVASQNKSAQPHNNNKAAAMAKQLESLDMDAIDARLDVLQSYFDSLKK